MTTSKPIATASRSPDYFDFLMMRHDGAWWRAWRQSFEAAHLPEVWASETSGCMIEPLNLAETAAIDSSAAVTERFWRSIPLLGWTIASIMWDRRTRPIIENIERQLRSRQKPDGSIWGRDDTRITLAQYICSIARQEMGWPNDHFIPGDAAGIVFWAHEDGLDVEAAVLDVEDHLGIKLEDAEVEKWFTQTLGDVVEALWLRQQTLNQENVWPPPPSTLK